jgi:flagellar basal-body rod protein FlgB
MPINFDTALGIHAEALRVRSQRAELLASNLANVDTPNYKAKDIDFQAALTNAMDTQSAQRLTTTNKQHFAVGGQVAEGLMAPIQYRMSLQDSLDGNTVDEHTEKSQFMQNAVQYQASVEFLGARFTGMKKALRGE